jgi:hypothetical protein
MLRSLAVLALCATVALCSCTEWVCDCPADGDVSAETEAEAEAAADADADVPADADTGPDADADVEPDAPGDAPTDTPAEADVAPPPPPPFSFVVFGDNQFATESCTSGVSERLAVPEVIRELAPDLVLSTGDLMDHGYDDGAYDAFVGCYAGMLGELPFFPTMGNHDAGSGGIWNYKAYLEAQLFTRNATVWPGDYPTEFTIAYEDDPNDYSTDFDAPTHRDIVPSGVSFETFYAFRFRNAYFLSLEIGTRYWSNTPKTWLDQHLAAAQADPTIDHTFVILHHPIYSTTMADTSTGECTGPVRDNYASYFHDRDATMVFSGHAHVYDRFWVPDDGHRTADAPPAAYPGGDDAVHYVVTGGGGGPLPTCSPMPEAGGVVGWEYSQARGCGYHVTLVEVNGEQLTVRVIGVDGTAAAHTTAEWDRFTIG